jgi:hypothetical protein
MAKPKVVCLIGSFVLTPLLLCAMLLGVVFVLAVGIECGWIPEPPHHTSGDLASRFVNTLLAISLIGISITVGKFLFRKCHGQ